MRIIDLSDTLRPETSPFELNRHEIRYVSHDEGLRMAEQVLKVPKSLLDALFPEGHAWAVENITLSTHSGTHVDAPYHYGPVSGGVPARTIDQLPLEWFFSDGVVLNMTHKQRGEPITERDVEQELARIGYTLKPLDIVLVRTDTSEHFGEPGYDLMHPGLTRGAVKFLVERGVRVIGIDAWGLDRPFDVLIEEVKAGRKGAFWEAHFFGKEQEYCQIEKLTNLKAIPRPFGFKVACFPVKIARASAGWTRAVAIIDDAPGLDGPGH